MPRIRTGYSFRKAAGKLEDVMSRLVECGYNKAPITDRASTFGWARWNKLCKKNNIEPVFGVELGVTDSLNAKKPAVDYWTFIAKDSVAPINKLVELATQQFRYEPLLTYEQALSANVFKITGNRTLINNIYPMEDLFISISPSTPVGLLKSLKEQYHLCACSDNKYPRETDDGFYEVVCGRNASLQVYPQHILTIDEWLDSINHLKVETPDWPLDMDDYDGFKDKKFGLTELDLGMAVFNTERILKDSTAKLEKATLIKPERLKPLRQMCIEGAEKLKVNLNNEVYAARLTRELDMIAKKNFEDYFYLVADIVEWSRQHMIVGPARGSSCGSLVCYLLGITTIDPIPFGLIFERFIDINRADLPDIDVDFSDSRREMVFDYLAQKYGQERIARLGVVTLFKPRSVLQEAGAALKIPKWECNSVAESIIERSGGDSRALQTLEDTLMEMDAGKRLLEKYPELISVCSMEGHPRHYSQHAAGIVVAQEPIVDFVAIDTRTGATMCDKKDADDYNLLKIDALGLTQLSVFEDCLSMAGLPMDFLDSLPLDCPEAFEVLNQGKFSGIFQFNGLALQSITKQFTVAQFDDIVSITALGRPGPLSSGGAHEWIKRKNGTHAVTYPHPCFEPYLKDTMGIVIFQEQVMEIGRNIGNLSWEEVSELRKAMSKSLGKEYFDRYGNPWKKGAIEKGVAPADADKIWDDLCAYGAWSFNKSHSVAYGLISYWCCWLKANFPFEFAAATLSHENDPDKQIKLLREMYDEGFDYVAIDPELSTASWTAGVKDGKKVLVGPLSNVKGIGPRAVNAIIGARARGEKIPENYMKKLEGAQTPFDSLWPIRSAQQRICPDLAERNIFTAPTKIINLEQLGEDYEVLLVCVFSSINPRDENEVIKCARRGGKRIEGDLTESLNLQMTDDTDTIFGKISRWDYPKIGKEIVDRGKPKKHLYAVKGTFKGSISFRMVMIKNVRYLGEI